VKIVRNPALLPGLLLLATLTACRSAPSRFYTLESTAVADRDASASYAVVIGPVVVPASVDRPEMVVQDAPNRVSLDEFNRWAAPLGDAIGRTVAGDLVKLLGTPRVATASLANFDADYRVSIEVQSFESIPGQSVLVDAVWVVHRSGGHEERSGRTVAHEPVLGSDYAAIAAAHSRALARLGGDLAAAIRSLAAHGS
jgi:uncharacterized lipoprotein YmbA